MDLQLSNKVILVTGGASGIGAAISLSLAAEGAIPVILGKSPMGAEFAAALHARQPRAVFHQIELSDEAACRDAVADTVARLGSIDGLVNNAGIIGARLRLQDLELAMLEQVFRVNTLATLLACREAVRRMSSEFGGGGGSIINVSSGAAVTGPIAFAEAGVKPADIQYASIYDSFTITVIMQIEDLGFCKKGEGGKFVSDGNLISGVGKLPFNTDGGGLCNNHPANRGGMTKVIEAVRQLRGEAHPAVQVPGCQLALASGPGLVLGSGHAHATLILERE
jgi:acetyl-CoA C-acetyltransferase